MREEIALNREISKNNEKVESIMIQLQKDHHSGKLRNKSAKNTRQATNNRTQGGATRTQDCGYLRTELLADSRTVRSSSVPNDEPQRVPTRTVSTPQVH